MSCNHIILLLGSNFGEREIYLETAQLYIQKEIGEIKQKSKIIETEPVGFDSPNYFLNQTLFVETVHSPISLLRIVKNIEHKMGRVYLPTSQRYQDRIIDIDILKYNKIIFESKNLALPHHQIFTRNFINELI